LTSVRIADDRAALIDMLPDLATIAFNGKNRVVHSKMIRRPAHQPGARPPAVPAPAQAESPNFAPQPENEAESRRATRRAKQSAVSA
jgi:hypothetical protein